MAYPMSTRVAKTYTEQVVKLQASNKLNPPQPHAEGHNYQVVGALVRSYGFEYVVGQRIAQGWMGLEFGTSRRQVPVTVLVLGDRDEDGEAGIRIVKETSKISDFSSLVLDAHFTTYCEDIRQYIVVYERFGGQFNFSQEDGGSFFEDNSEDVRFPANSDEGRFQLTRDWALRMRQLVELLDYAESSKVTHGGLGNRECYVISEGRIKLIGVARNTGGYCKGKDLTDLRSFIKYDPFFRGNSSEEWLTLDSLLDSDLVKNFSEGWKDAVLGHPILQLTADDTLLVYRGVHKSRLDMSLIGATKLANLLWKYQPQLYTDTCVTLPRAKKNRGMDEAYMRKVRHLRKKAFKDAHPKQGQLIDALFNYSPPPPEEGQILYGGEMVHLEKISLGKNMIHHGDTIPHFQFLADKQKMLREVRYHFGSYFSKAYFFVRTLDEQQDPYDGPYKAEAAQERATAAEASTALEAARAQKPTLGDYFRFPF